jgi:hypothetical protein
MAIPGQAHSSSVDKANAHQQFWSAAGSGAIVAGETVRLPWPFVVNTDPLLFGIGPNNVYAVKTREGAIALVEVVEESRLGPTRLRYKLVRNSVVNTVSSFPTTAVFGRPPVQ